MGETAFFSDFSLASTGLSIDFVLYEYRNATAGEEHLLWNDDTLIPVSYTHLTLPTKA